MPYIPETVTFLNLDYKELLLLLSHFSNSKLLDMDIMLLYDIYIKQNKEESAIA